MKVRIKKLLLHRVISWLLIITLMTTMLPSFGGGKASAQEKDEKKFEIGTIKNKEELIDLRTEETKTFRNANGSFTTQISQSPLHYKAKNSKKWLDIDNKLSENTNEVYNKKNKFQVKFNKKHSQNVNLVDITEDTYSIGLNPDIPTAESISINQGTIKENTITYNNVFPNTQLKYTLSNDGVKEDIVLLKKPKAQDPSVYSFQLSLSGLGYKQQEDGSIQLFDAK